jgi:site-specific recombinase XerD
LIGASAFRAACFDVPEFRKRRFSPHDRNLNSVTIQVCIVTVSLPERAKAMENQHAHFEAPTAVNVTVAMKRPREYLKEPEIERLMEAARKNRQGHRDATAILLAYRHGLRASELVSLRWDDLDLAHGRLHVRRSKGGETAVHPIGGKEMRALRRLQREAMTQSVYVFISERGAPLSVAGYQRMVARAGRAAKFPFLIHSHMLRHSTGYKLANDGHDTRAIHGYLCHRSIVSTQRYTALAPDRFKRFWKD